eukprot:4466635-Pyramimonas_sp.AAC.1
MFMLQHSSARVLRCKAAYSLPIYADKPILAGSRRSNNVAKTIVYAVLARVTGLDLCTPKPVPRGWFDDISIRVTGSKEAVIDGMVKATSELRDALKAHGLNLADKYMLFSTNLQGSKKIQKKLAEAKIDIQT